MDYVINSKNTLSAHYFLSRDPETAPFGCTNGVCYPDTGINYRYMEQLREPATHIDREQPTS